VLLEIRILLSVCECWNMLVDTWENIRSWQERKEIGIKTKINLNTHESFSLHLTENVCVTIMNTILLRSLLLCTSL